MTDQGKKLQRAHLQVELEDAQNELSHLREKALATSEETFEIHRKLMDSARLEPSVDDFSMRIDTTNRLRPDQQLDIPAILKLTEELKLARQKVYNLQERKKQLANTA